MNAVVHTRLKTISPVSHIMSDDLTDREKRRIAGAAIGAAIGSAVLPFGSFIGAVIGGILSG